MKMANHKGTANFCLGLGIGVAAAILFAPRSGKDARDIIRSKAHDGADHLKRQGQKLANQANDQVEKGMRTVRRQAENVMAAVAAVDAGRDAFRRALASPRIHRS
jgi:gas vesicle protein